MGNPQIGILLGAHRGGQSFESVSSWTVAAQSSLSTQTSDVHSSANGGLLEVWSSAATAATLIYDYRKDDDAFARWFNDVTTHEIVLRGWARIDTAGNSGDISAALPSASAAIPHDAAALQYISMETSVVSGDDLRLLFNRQASTGSYNLYLDDLTVAADVIDLHPNWQANEGRDQLMVRHTALSGFERQYTWNRKGAWILPLQHVPSSHADLINHWWYHGWPLYFTFDSSDDTQTQIVRITNQTQPMGTVSRPYWNWHSGNLELTQITQGLAF